MGVQLTLPMKFVHLHVHSHYSLLDGLSKVPDIVRFAQEDGSNAIAITDHGVMYGVIEFYQKCIKAGVKPIIGMEMYTTTGSRFDRTLTKGQKQTNHLLLLAKNNIGYKNLLKITSIGHLEGYYYKPRVDWETLEKYHEGLIACSACLGGEIPQLIINGKDDEAKKRIMEYAKLFGQDNYYLELQYHPDLEWQEKVNNKLIEFSKELNLPLVATNDPHYVHAEDNEAQDILLCLQNKAKKAETNRMSMLGGNYSLRPTEEMVELFKHVPEAIENTVKIAEMCNVEIELNNIQLPYFEVPEGYDEFTYLEKISRDGLKDRYGKSYEEIEAVYRERLDYELSVIKKMGWPSYFSIVADFVRWSRENGIVVGPGRGSAAGSLVCYSIGITNLCPIKYDLLFERFLNPDRISMPDIDLDFADTRRNEVIAYVQEKYGEDHVAQIITFGTMAARAAVRDVGRVLDYPYDYCDKISKAIPMFTKISQALDTVPDFQEIYQEPDAKIIIDYAMKLEGVARHASVHACGILITKDPLTDNVPVQHASSADKTLVSQYSLHPVEDLGLLKMDFLGLRNLSVIESAIDLIKGTTGVEIDINKIPLDDPKAFKLFQKAETTGVFQFECLSGDTIVSNTTIKKLYEKKDKEKLLSVYLNDGSVHKNKILKVVQSGTKELYALVAENNRYIKASANHQFLTEDGWKKLSELQVGDKILIKSKVKHLLYNVCKGCGKQIDGQKDGKSDFCYSCSANHRKGGFRKDLGHYVRSAWEADFARILKLHNVDYDYEPQSFVLKKANGEVVNYTPDFYTSVDNTFYEIKGWMHEADQEKIDLFRQQYSQYNFVLISSVKFAELALKYKKLIDWECPKVPDNFQFVVIKKIESCGSEMTYDIAMQSPGNNFIANGFVVHNSSGMKRYLRELQATEFEDIIAMVALYRPGPMEWIPDYIAGKHGKKQIVYLHPKLEPILNKTYGVAIYQEQVMRMARDVAGFTMGEADVLRKAMGKKIAKLLEEQRDKFLKGSVANGLSEALGEKLFSFIEPFAGYGFNRCLSGDTKITDARTGKQHSLTDLYNVYEKKGKLPSVFTLNDDLKLLNGKITAVYNNGVKFVYEVRTRLGRTIKATANHPFRTFFGWQKLEELKVGERIAVVRNVRLPQRAYEIDDFKLAVLGYLMSEGNLCHPQSFYFYSSSQNEIKDYVQYLKQFNNTKATLNTSKLATSVYAGRIDLKKTCEAVEWIKSIGIHYMKAINKKLPDFVFQLNNEQLSLLIGKMFQGDGCVSVSRKDPQIFYATSSEEMAKQFQHLLLKLEIVSTIHRKKFKYRGEIKIGYTISINRYNNVFNFWNGPGQHLIGQKFKNIKYVIENNLFLNNVIPKNAAHGSKDIVPAEVIDIIRNEIKNQGYNFKQFAKEHGLSERLLFHDNRKDGYLRETILLIGKALKNKQIINFSNSDVYWDEIVEIKEIGKMPTYDLTIDGTHNYVANDIVVHNSHAACYAMVGYQTAYLKANYPAQFMAALLTADQQETDRVAIEIEECRNMEIQVKQPDINQSYESFTVVTSKTELGEKVSTDEKINIIRFGLNAIKNVGAHIAEMIIKERKANGPFKGMSDFLERIEDKDLNKKSLESLIKTGAFDKFGERGELLHNSENMLSFHRQVAQEKNNNQISLFANNQSQDMMLKLNLESAPPVGNFEKLVWEKELLGLYISDHPFNSYKRQLSNLITPLASLKEAGNDTQVLIAGVVISIKKILTRKNDNMLFVKIEDGVDSLEILVFPKLLLTTQEIWKEGQVIICQGSISDKDGETKILANKCGQLNHDTLETDLEAFKKIEAAPARNGNSQGYKTENGYVRYQQNEAPARAEAVHAPLKLVIDYEKMNEDLLNRLKIVLSENPGRSPVYLKIIKDQTTKVIESSLRVNNNYNLIEIIKADFKDVIKLV